VQKIIRKRRCRRFVRTALYIVLLFYKDARVRVINVRGVNGMGRLPGKGTPPPEGTLSRLQIFIYLHIGARGHCAVSINNTEDVCNIYIVFYAHINVYYIIYIILYCARDGGKAETN